MLFFKKQNAGLLRSARSWGALGLVLALAVVTFGYAQQQGTQPNPNRVIAGMVFQEIPVNIPRVFIGSYAQSVSSLEVFLRHGDRVVARTHTDINGFFSFNVPDPSVGLRPVVCVGNGQGGFFCYEYLASDCVVMTPLEPVEDPTFNACGLPRVGDSGYDDPVKGLYANQIGKLAGEDGHVILVTDKVGGTVRANGRIRVKPGSKVKNKKVSIGVRNLLANKLISEFEINVGEGGVELEPISLPAGQYLFEIHDSTFNDWGYLEFSSPRDPKITVAAATRAKCGGSGGSADAMIEHGCTIPPIKTIDPLRFPEPVTGKAEICVFKFEDKDGDGKKGPNEPLLAGWTFNVSPGPPTSVTTGPQGGVCFFVVSAPATHTITEVQQAGWTPTTPNPQNVQVQPGVTVEVKFGNQKKDEKFEICGIKWNDLNGNGKQDLGEPGLSNWTINLVFGTPPNLIDLQAITDASGRYCFKGLAAGTYIASETSQSGWVQTFPQNPATHTVTLPPSKTDVNFGNQKKDGKAEICVFKFEDKDGDGKKGPNEPLLAGWTFNVNPGPPNQVTTGPQGGICFGVSAPGTVTITEVVQSGWTPTTQTSQQVTVQPGQLVNVFFGNRKKEAGRCDLAIRKEVKGGRLISGQQAAYTVTIVNIGDGNCDPTITVTDNLGPGIIFNSAGGPPGVVCGAVGQIVTCTRNTPLGAGQSFQIQINVTVKIDPGKQAGNCAAVKNPNDVNLRNNEVCITTVVQKS